MHLLVQDVDRARGDHDRQHEAHGGLHQHQHLRPAAERHRVRRAERRRVRERDVEVVEEDRPPAGAAPSSAVCCGKRKSRSEPSDVRRAAGPPSSSSQNQSAKSRTFVHHMCTAARSSSLAYACSPTTSRWTSRMIEAPFAALTSAVTVSTARRRPSRTCLGWRPSAVTIRPRGTLAAAPRTGPARARERSSAPPGRAGRRAGDEPRRQRRVERRGAEDRQRRQQRRLAELVGRAPEDPRRGFDGSHSGAYRHAKRPLPREPLSHFPTPDRAAGRSQMIGVPRPPRP